MLHCSIDAAVLSVSVIKRKMQKVDIAVTFCYLY